MTKKNKESKHSHASISTSLIPCMQCGKSAHLVQIPETIPLFGKVLLQTYSCSHCGFKWSDVMSLEFGKPSGFEVKVENETDLSTKLVRNASGTVEIPELGVLIEPGPFAEGFFTNMEGLLERVESVLAMLARSEDNVQAKEAKERIKAVKKCREGKMVFVVRVLDPFGGSALIGDKVKRWNLTKKEVEKLKKGTMVM